MSLVSISTKVKSALSLLVATTSFCPIDAVADPVTFVIEGTFYSSIEPTLPVDSSYSATLTFDPLTLTSASDPLGGKKYSYADFSMTSAAGTTEGQVSISIDTNVVLNRQTIRINGVGMSGSFGGNIRINLLGSGLSSNDFPDPFPTLVDFTGNTQLLLNTSSTNFATVTKFEPAPRSIPYSISVNEGEATLIFESEIGRCYEVWSSESLEVSDWNGPFHTVFGTGDSLNYAVSVSGFPKRFFQVHYFDLAPEQNDFFNLSVGYVLPNTSYYITSSTRFEWMGKPGNWSYQKEGNGSAKLIFTYDEDGNNPAVYREEILLNYTAKGSGNFRYSEVNSNVEDAARVALGPYSFGTPGGVPDLSIYSLTHTPATPTEGSPTTFVSVIKNMGDAPSVACNLQIGIENEISSPIYEIPPLAPSATYTVTRQATLGPGSYAITATADFGNAVNESDEENNEATDSFTVASSGLAPSATAFSAQMVGRTLPGTDYDLNSATRFDWNGEFGNWTYRKTGPNTALLHFTYDEDGNDSDVYYEEYSLTYTGEGIGTAVYSEYSFGQLIATGSGAFDFN